MLAVQSLDLDSPILLASQASHFCAEMILSSLGLDGGTDILDYLRQTISANMRVGIDQYLRIGPEINELLENLFDVSTL